ncbi:MAG: MG2 domain-containing protein, partial [Caldilineaceae bacterium]
WQDTPPAVPGELLYDEVIPTKARQDTPTETNIPLGEFLNAEGKGHLIVIVDIPRPLFGDQTDMSVVQSWVQSTDLMLDAMSDHESLFTWATELATGAPASDVTVELYGTPLESTTAADGTWLTPLTDQAGYMLVATRGEGDAADSSILPRNQWDFWGESGWKRQSPQDELRWFVFDDRQLYRPGEEVHLKGWIRRMGYGPTGDLGLVGDTPATIQYYATDTFGNMVSDGVLELNALDGFDFSFTLPTNINLGSVGLQFIANGISNVSSYDYYHAVQVQEFRRPEFSVSAQPEGEGPWILGDAAQVSVEASYYAGGALPGAPAVWQVNASLGSYSPPGWSNFVFGVWQPWWYGDPWSIYGADFGPSAFDSTMQPSNTWVGQTDALGKHYLNLEFLSSQEPRPYAVSAEAVVQDVNRQSWASTANLLVHPAALYVGLRSNDTFIEAGSAITIETIVTDIDGKAV